MTFMQYIVLLLLGCDSPLLKDLYDHVAPKVADKWKDIGVQLLDPTLINDRVLDVIEADHPHSVEKCCKRVFEKWLSTKEDASWNQLIEAIKIVELKSLASQLKNSLIGNVYICIYNLTISTKNILAVKKLRPRPEKGCY